MLWTCTQCNYNRISWRPRTWSEAQVGDVARAYCKGLQPRALTEARGFLFIDGRYVLDTPIRCPRCHRSFYPGDALDRAAEAASSEPVPSKAARRLAG